MNDNNVVALPGVVPQAGVSSADPDIIAMLEELLKEAKNGSMRWCGVAWVDKVGVGHSVYEPDLSEDVVGSTLTCAMGATAWLDKRLAYNAMGGAVEYPLGGGPSERA